MPTAIIKEEAHKIIDQTPAGATWDDLMHKICVRELIEQGLADSKAGRTRDVKEIRAKYGLPSTETSDQVDVLAVIHCAMNIVHSPEETDD